MKVPDGWKKIRIDDVSELVTSGSRGWAKYYSDEGDHFLRITNLRRDKIIPDYKNLKFIKLPNGSSEGQRTRLQKSDILISITADLGIIGFIDKNPSVPSYINQHIALVRLDQTSVSPRFLAYYLASRKQEHSIKRMNDAGAKAGLSLTTIRQISLQTPPLPEQQKIAEILSTWDRAIEATEKLIATSEAQKKALMQQLLTGHKRLKGFNGEWEKIQFKEIATISSGFAFKSKDFVESDGARIIRMSDLKGGFISEKNFALVRHESVKSLERFSLNEGDFLFGMSGSLSNFAWVRKSDLPLYLNQRVGKLIAKKSNNSLFVQMLYLSPQIQSKILSTASGAAQLNISSNFLNKMKLKVPPLPEQIAIAAILSDADHEIELQQQKLATLKLEKSALMQQLLTGKRRAKIDNKKEIAA